jgi:hypothetical protein
MILSRYRQLTGGVGAPVFCGQLNHEGRGMSMSLGGGFFTSIIIEVTQLSVNVTTTHLQMR